MTICKSCLDGFYLEQIKDKSFCIRKLPFFASIQEIHNPKLFLLSLSESWSSYMMNISQLLGLEISNFGQSEFNFRLEPITTQSLYIYLNYSKKVEPKTQLRIALAAPAATEESKYFDVIGTALNITLSEYDNCGERDYWSSGTFEND